MTAVRHLGDFIREQRGAAQISLRQLALQAGVSNPYLSQIERGLRKPSAEILQQIAKGLRISAEVLYVQAGILEHREASPLVDAVLADDALTERQKQVLLEIHDSFRKENLANAALAAATWNVACIFGGINCPPGAGPDFDFGAGANLMTIDLPGGKKMLVVGAGQKSGQYWMLNAATGAVLWNTQVGPGSTLGGIEWGTATDGERIYVAIGNSNHLPYPGRPDLGNAGSFAALDPATGAVLWQVKDPNPFVDLGAVSVSNGVVYAGSMSGHMYALDAENGKIGWTYLGAGSSNAGPAIDNDGAVFWGNGYERFGLGTPGHTFYAFSRRGR